MSSQFVALPVGQGDAFYLRRGNVHILVDGGRSVRALPKLLSIHASPPRLDVVVCTHNDADHANGIIGLLEELPVPIREVWLPGTWAWRFEDLVATPPKFFRELIKNIVDVEKSVVTLEQYYEQIRNRLRLDPEAAERTPSQEAGERIDTWFINILEERGFLAATICLYDTCPCVFREVPVHQQWLLLECMRAARRIRNIVWAALNAGARIRLFEFVQSPQMASGGWRGQLEPINSREVWPHRQPISALAYLALTKANRESLVFYAPEQVRNIPSVLFTADSDLAGGLTHIHPPSANILVTAPHHGSEANASVYAAVSAWIGADRAIWVRSDSRSRRRPGKTFKSQPKRLCTLCNSGKTFKTPVRLNSVQSYWQKTRGTQWCSCV